MMFAVNSELRVRSKNTSNRFEADGATTGQDVDLDQAGLSVTRGR